MKKPDRILVPTDFSEGARAAYHYASFLAGTIGGTIDLLHRIPTFKYFQDSFNKLGVPLSMERDYIPQVQNDTRNSLEEDMTRFIKKAHQGTCFTKVGPNAAETILDFANKGKYDLIVLGSRGDSEDQYLKMGSVTTRIVKQATIPVIAVPKTLKPRPIKNIMVPTDYSDESLQALRPAAFIAHKTGAKITLFHVLELYGSLSEAHNIPSGSNRPEAARDRILNKMRGFLTSSEDYNLRLNIAPNGKGHSFEYSLDGDAHSIPVDLVVDRGFSAHYQIVTYANEHADLLVISTHGRSGLQHLMLGSTVEKVTQWSEIPVMTNRIRFK